MENLNSLIEYALEAGADQAAVIAAADIVIDPRLADKCRESQCPNYGLSKSCPPYVTGPFVLKKQLETFTRAVFFKIDVPSGELFSGKFREIFQLLHKTAAGIEQAAVKQGFPRAQAYAGGSCKELFCHEHADCPALSEKGQCRHPQHARPSMSGFGINVAGLFKTAGWTLHLADHQADSRTKIANICGLVLIC